MKVTLIDRKNEATTHKTGVDFLYGQPIAHGFPIELFLNKWNNRFQKESDDHQAAPLIKYGLAWDGLEDDRIPWEALKSAWQRSQPTLCVNCDQPTILVNFGLKQIGWFNRSPNFISVCPKCQRSFVDDSIQGYCVWMKKHLDKNVYPKYDMIG